MKFEVYSEFESAAAIIMTRSPQQWHLTVKYRRGPKGHQEAGKATATSSAVGKASACKGAAGAVVKPSHLRSKVALTVTDNVRTIKWAVATAGDMRHVDRFVRLTAAATAAASNDEMKQCLQAFRDSSKLRAPKRKE